MSTVSAVTASLAACMSLVSGHYGVAPASLEASIEQTRLHPSAERVGVTGIPVQWLPYLQQYGFDAKRVQTDPCENLTAAAWILAYTSRLQTQLRAYASPARMSSRAKEWQPTINWVAAQAQMDPALINAVIDQESKYNPFAVSPAGAIGMMQIMPFNAKAWGINPFDPAQNIWAGTWHLKYLMAKYGGNIPLALAAYNAGSGAVDKYGGIPPYPETLKYVPIVLRKYVALMAQR